MFILFKSSPNFFLPAFDIANVVSVCARGVKVQASVVRALVHNSPPLKKIKKKKKRKKKKKAFYVYYNVHGF